MSSGKVERRTSCPQVKRGGGGARWRRRHRTPGERTRLRQSYNRSALASEERATAQEGEVAMGAHAPRGGAPSAVWRSIAYSSRRPCSAALDAYCRAAAARRSSSPNACSTSRFAIVENRLARALFGSGDSG
eukprot:11518717-Alexandrium_andersonii.AAC.1